MKTINLCILLLVLGAGLRLGLRGRRARLRVLRGVHHGLHLRRDPLARHAGGPEGRGQPGAVQGRRPLLLPVSHGRHRSQALHEPGGLQPDRRGSLGIMERVMDRAQFEVLGCVMGCAPFGVEGSVMSPAPFAKVPSEERR
mgnify:CR=1 FL=1